VPAFRRSDSPPRLACRAILYRPTPEQRACGIPPTVFVNFRKNIDNVPCGVFGKGAVPYHTGDLDEEIWAVSGETAQFGLRCKGADGCRGLCRLDLLPEMGADAGPYCAVRICKRYYRYSGMVRNSAQSEPAAGMMRKVFWHGAEFCAVFGKCECHMCGVFVEAADTILCSFRKMRVIQVLYFGGGGDALLRSPGSVRYINSAGNKYCAG